MNQPINQLARWKRKKTGESFRIGMADPPAPNMKPPSGKRSSRAALRSRIEGRKRKRGAEGKY